MKKSGMLFVLVLIMALAFPMTVFAQGIDGETETFDSAELEGWELSPETAVVDGVLKISPGHLLSNLGIILTLIWNWTSCTLRRGS